MAEPRLKATPLCHSFVFIMSAILNFCSFLFQELLSTIEAFGVIESISYHNNNKALIRYLRCCHILFCLLFNAKSYFLLGMKYLIAKCVRYFNRKKTFSSDCTYLLANVITTSFILSTNIFECCIFRIGMRNSRMSNMLRICSLSYHAMGFKFYT